MIIRLLNELDGRAMEMSSLIDWSDLIDLDDHQRLCNHSRSSAVDAHLMDLDLI